MECFICFGGDEDPGNNAKRNRLLMLSMSGCHCHPWVHTKCIRQWGNTADTKKCPVCRQVGENYTLTELRRLSNERVIPEEGHDASSDRGGDYEWEINGDYMLMANGVAIPIEGYQSQPSLEPYIPQPQPQPQPLEQPAEQPPYPAYVNDPRKRELAKKLLIVSCILILVYMSFLLFDSIMSTVGNG